MFQVLLMFHMIADFIFQNDKDVEFKMSKPIYGNLKHMFKTLLVYFVLGITFMIYFKDIEYKVIIVLVILAAAHFLIDITKTFATKMIDRKFYNAENIFKEKYKFALFIIDQTLHLLSIYFILKILPLTIIFNNTIVIWINAIVISTFVGHEVIKLILKVSNKDYCEDKKNFSSAKMIGILERLIITPAVILGYPQVVAIILGLKVFTNFRDEDSKVIDRNAFIIGNLLSIVMAFLGVLYYWNFN